MRCGGFQKCVVNTRSGRVQRAAMAVMLRPEVLDASTASGAARASIRAKSSCFHARSSGPDSTTRSAPAIDWSKSVEPSSSSRARSTSAVPASSLSVSIRPWALRLFQSLCRALRRYGSSRVARIPPRASVRAIPGPIIPVPTTPAVANLVCDIAVILAARACAAVTELILESVDFVLARSTRALEQ